MKKVSTLIGVIIIVVVIVIIFCGFIAYQYLNLIKPAVNHTIQTPQNNHPVQNKTENNTPPQTTSNTVPSNNNGQNLNDPNYNSEHISPDAIIFSNTGNVFPKFKNIANSDVLNSINQILSFKNVTGYDLSEVGTNSGFQGVTYKINYDSNNILSISFVADYMGAYPSENTQNYSINLNNGKNIILSDIFYQNKISDLLNLLNTKLQDNINQNLTTAQKLNPSGQGSECSVNTINEGLQAGNGYDKNYGMFTEDNLNNPSQLDGTTQSTSIIVSNNGVDFVYNFDFAHAIQACQPDGKISLSYSQLKDYINPNGLLGNMLNKIVLDNQIENAPIPVPLAGTEATDNGTAKLVNLVNWQYLTPDCNTTPRGDNCYGDSIAGYPDSQDGSIFFGNLNGDGTPDAVAILDGYCGGAGTCGTSLGVWIYNNGTPVYATELSLGYRPNIKSISINNGVLTIDLYPSDTSNPQYPNQPEEIDNYKLVNNKFYLIGKELKGSFLLLRLATQRAPEQP
jgi:hypothetical protein